MRLATALLIAFSASSALAQSVEPVLDPLTAEPVPMALTAPPATTSPDRGEWEPIEVLFHLPEGSTRAVRFTPAGIIFQNGAAVVAAEVIIPLGRGEAEIQEYARAVLDFQPQDIFVGSAHVYVAARGLGGLKILAPDDLALLGEAPGFDALAVAAGGDFAFVGAGSGGLRVYDVSSPSSPVLVTTVLTGGSANGLHLEGSLLYVANGNPSEADNLLIVDVADPAEPQLLGGFDADAFVTNVAVSGGAAFLSGGFGLLALDVSDPAAPLQLDAFPGGDATTFEVAVEGDELVVAGLAGLFHLDVSDPADMQLIGSFLIDGQGLGAAISPQQDYALLGDRYNGVRMLNLQTASDPVQVAFHRNGGFSHKVAFGEDVLYVTDLAGGLRIFELVGFLPEPDGAVELARIELPSDTQWPLLDGDLVYVTDAGEGTGLTIIEVTDPGAPQVIGSWGSANQAFGLTKDGDVLYVAAGFAGLIALDVNDPQNPTELGSIAFGSNIMDVAILDGVAYLASFGGGMIAVDISDPTDMAQISAMPEWGFLTAVDSRWWLTNFSAVALADAAAGVRWAGVADPENPTSSTVEVPFAGRGVSNGLALGGDAHFDVTHAADDFFGLRVFEVGGAEIASFRSADRGIGIDSDMPDNAFASRVALASGETGIYLFRGFAIVSSEGESVAGPLLLHPPFPNPVATRGRVVLEMETSAAVHVELFDILGRRGFLIHEGALPAGAHSFELEASGLASGTYLVRASGAGFSVSRTVTVLR